MRAWTSSPSIAKSAKIIPTQLGRSSTSPGWCAAPRKGEGLGNQFLANIREVDAIVHVLRCFEDGDVTHVEGSGRSDRRRRDGRDRADARRPRQPREAALPPLARSAKGGDKEAKSRSTVMDARARRCCATASRRAPSIHATPEEACRLSLAAADRASRCSMSATSTKPSAATGNACSQGRRDGQGPGRRSGGHLRRDRGRSRALPDEAENEFLETLGLDETGLDACHPRRLQAARPHHLLHRRPEGSARLDRPPGAKAPKRPASSTPISNAASSAPRPSPMTISRPGRRSRRQGSRQGARRRQGIPRPGRRVFGLNSCLRFKA